MSLFILRSKQKLITKTIILWKFSYQIPYLIDIRKKGIILVDPQWSCSKEYFTGLKQKILKRSIAKFYTQVSQKFLSHLQYLKMNFSPPYCAQGLSTTDSTQLDFRKLSSVLHIDIGILKDSKTYAISQNNFSPLHCAHRQPIILSWISRN